MNKIFVINGRPLAGKTTFGEIVGRQLRERGINFLHTSSIDPVKNLLLPSDEWYDEFQNPNLKPHLEKLKREVTHLDWNGRKDDYWRKVMSDLKLKLIDEFPTLINGWVIHQSTKLNEPWVMFVDIREPENINNFARFCENNSNAKFKSVLVESIRAIESANKSDESVYDMVYDITVRNDGDINDLEATVKGFVEASILNDFGRREIRY